MSQRLFEPTASTMAMNFLRKASPATPMESHPPQVRWTSDKAFGVVVSLKVHLNLHKLSYLRGLC
jgi:hypothetical protein